MNKSGYTKFGIHESIEKIKYLQRMVNFVLCPYQKFYYSELLKHETNKLRQLNNYSNNSVSKQVNPENQKEFTIEALAEYDGSNGKPAYVAVNGIVYDVSTEITWGGGTHFGLYAGNDLTNDFMRCHGKNEEILKNLPKVGVIKK